MIIRFRTTHRHCGLDPQSIKQNKIKQGGSFKMALMIFAVFCAYFAIRERKSISFKKLNMTGVFGHHMIWRGAPCPCNKTCDSQIRVIYQYDYYISWADRTYIYAPYQTDTGISGRYIRRRDFWTPVSSRQNGIYQNSAETNTAEYRAGTKAISCRTPDGRTPRRVLRSPVLFYTRRPRAYNPGVR